MSIFEVLMMICFGFAWPFSIWKSWRSKSTKGKSIYFLLIVVLGYAAGIAHKIVYNFDYAIIFYAINAVLVALDIALYYRNLFLYERKK